MYPKDRAPVPPPSRRGKLSGRTPLYPFNSLAVDESFYVPGDAQVQSLALAAARAWRLRRRRRGLPERAFVSERYGNNGIRIWRVADPS